MTREILFGRQICGNLEESSVREWLCTDGLGGFAFGTAAGLRTRRYHGLLIVSDTDASTRNLALAALDLTVKINGTPFQLSTHEWTGGIISPAGYIHLEQFEIKEGIPTWHFNIGEMTLTVEVAMDYGSSAVEVSYCLQHSPGPVEIEVKPLCTWRNADQERFGTKEPQIDKYDGGFLFENAFFVEGPGYLQNGLGWYNGVYYRVEANRGLPPTEDLFCAGSFNQLLSPGETTYLRAWAKETGNKPEQNLADKSRRRRTGLYVQAKAGSDPTKLLCGAADQFIIKGPNVIAGYPWFGVWSRDALISYSGLFLATRRFTEGRAFLKQMCEELNDGLLPNTTIGRDRMYNSVDAPLWLIQAIFAHYKATRDKDLLNEVLPSLTDIVTSYTNGTQYNIKLDQSDFLIACGAENTALTWMDARINDIPVTMRAGKPVEINALWISGLQIMETVASLCGQSNASFGSLYKKGLQGFMKRFPNSEKPGLYDVVDSFTGTDRTASTQTNDDSCRPNQLLALALGLFDAHIGTKDPYGIMRSVAPLVTHLGLRTLSPADARYMGRHRGNQYQRDTAYHQGTVWPYLLEYYITGLQKTGRPYNLFRESLESHIFDYGLGSVSETFEGDAPHAATGCPFQAWSAAACLKIFAETDAGKL